MNKITKTRLILIREYVKNNPGTTRARISRELKIDKEKVGLLLNHLEIDKQIKFKNYFGSTGSYKPVRVYYPWHFEINPVVYKCESTRRFVEGALNSIFGADAVSVLRGVA